MLIQLYYTIDTSCLKNLLCLPTTIDRFTAILWYPSEFGVVFTMRASIHTSYKAILHKNCHISSANRIVWLDPNYVALMSMHCMISELE